MPAVAVTDHGNLFSVLDFYQKAMKAGIKPIIGCEIYVAPGSRFEKSTPGGNQEEASYHLILLSRNKQGYKNLVKLVTAAYLEGFYYKPRIDKELLKQYHEGLSASPRAWRRDPLSPEQQPLRRREKAALQYQELLGKENFYLELQTTGYPSRNR